MGQAPPRTAEGPPPAAGSSGEVRLPPMHPGEFLQRHVARRSQAVEAASALRAGDPEPVRRLLAGSWLRAGAPADDALLQRLGRGDPQADSIRGHALFGPLPPADHPCLAPGRVAERIRLRRLLEQAAPGPVEAGDDPVAVHLYLLAFLGDETARLERAAWRDAAFAADPDLDERARAWWSLWFQLPTARPEPGRGVPPALGPAGWASLLAGWKALFRPHALRAYRGVLEHVNCPERHRRHHLAELREASFARMLGGEGPYFGWVEIAARVVERGGGGQIEALAGLCDLASLRRVAGCAAHRGSLATTLRGLYPAIAEPDLRALDLERALLAGPGQLDALLDAHVAFRLIEAFLDGAGADLDRSWRVVRQNRGRAAARLRAVICESSAISLGAHLLSLPALYARTAAAVRAYFWAWGLDLITHASGDPGSGLRVFCDPALGTPSAVVDFSYDPDRDVTPACREDGDLPGALNADERRALGAWVLLVVLRGRLRQLERWVATGGGDKDGTWGRLLADELPDALRDAGSADRARGGYRRLRLALATSLPELRAEIAPILDQIAALRPGRGLPAAVLALLAPRWHPAVRLPSGGFPTLQRHAQEAVAPFTAPGSTP